MANYIVWLKISIIPVNELLCMDIFNSKADLLKSYFGFFSSGEFIQFSVVLQPISQSLSLAKLHDNVQKRRGPDSRISSALIGILRWCFIGLVFRIKGGLWPIIPNITWFLPILKIHRKLLCYFLIIFPNIRYWRIKSIFLFTYFFQFDLYSGHYVRAQTAVHNIICAISYWKKFIYVAGNCGNQSFPEMTRHLRKCLSNWGISGID